MAPKCSTYNNALMSPAYIWAGNCLFTIELLLAIIKCLTQFRNFSDTFKVNKKVLSSGFGRQSGGQCRRKSWCKSNNVKSERFQTTFCVPVLRRLHKTKDNKTRYNAIRQMVMVSFEILFFKFTKTRLFAIVCFALDYDFDPANTCTNTGIPTVAW